MNKGRKYRWIIFFVPYIFSPKKSRAYWRYTPEIGIRLTIGAFERDVMVQFLVEAVMLSLVGGLAGIGLGLACSMVAASVIGIPFILNLKIVVIAFAFSGLVGMLFGFFPARRAARLDPIDALRYE